MIKTFPEDFAAQADGLTPAQDAIQAALNEIELNGGGELDLSRGLYAVTGPIFIPNTIPVTIRGNGYGTGLVPRAGLPLNSYILSSYGGGIAFHDIISKDATVGDLGVSASQVDQFKKGDTVKISAATTSGAGTVIWGQQHNEVVEVSGDFLVLAMPLAFSLQAGAWLEKTDLRRGLVIADFSVIALDANVDHNAIVLTWERGALVENIVTEGQGDYTQTHERGAGLVLSDGYQNTVRNVTVSRGGSNGEDAIALRIQSALMADMIRSIAGVFGIGITATDSQFSNLSSMRDYGRGIKLNSTKCCRFNNLMIGGSRHVGLALTSGTSNNAFDGVTVRGINTPNGQNTGVWLNGESNNNNKVANLITQNVPYPIAQSPTDLGNTFV